MSTIELSIAETNRLRQQLGLALIPEAVSVQEPAGSLDRTASKGEATEAQTKPEEAECRKSTETPEKPENSEKPEKPAKKIITYEDYDTASWLDTLGSAPVLEQQVSEKPEAEEGKFVVQHSSEELASLRDGEILHLQDAGVIDDEEDALINEDLARKKKVLRDEKERRNQQLLRDGKAIEAGTEAETVSLDGNTIKIETPQVEEKDLEEKDLEAFREHSERRPVTFKKSKKKQTKKRKREPDSMPELMPEEVMVTEVNNEGEEDNELEKALSASLAKKRASRKVKSADEVANDVMMHQRMDMADSEIGMVYDNTQDFLDSLRPGTAEKLQKRDEDGEKENVGENTENVEEKEREKKENVEEKEREKKEIAKETEENIQKKENATATSQDEAAFSLSATLKNIRETVTPETQKKQKLLREQKKDAELARLRIKIEERVLADELAKDSEYARMTPENQQQVFDRELNERLVNKGIVEKFTKKHKYAQYGADQLRDYDPEVSIQYQDSKGHVLDVKQAWKELSHKYHGSAPKKRRG